MVDVIKDGSLEFLTADELQQLRNCVPQVVAQNKMLQNMFKFDGDELKVIASGITATVKTLVHMSDETANGSDQTYTHSGTYVEVINQSDSDPVVLTVAGHSKIIYKGDSFSIDTAQFSSFTVQASAGILYSITVCA